jgi:hypothetical protein
MHHNHSRIQHISLIAVSTIFAQLQVSQRAFDNFSLISSVHLIFVGWIWIESDWISVWFGSSFDGFSLRLCFSLCWLFYLKFLTLIISLMFGCFSLLIYLLFWCFSLMISICFGFVHLVWIGYWFVLAMSQMIFSLGC